MDNQTELIAAETLLERGVKVQIVAPLLIRMLGKTTVTLTLRSPCYGTMLRVSSYYLQTGITSNDLEDLTIEGALRLFKDSGKLISMAVACAIINHWILGKILTKPLAWYLRNSVAPKKIFYYMNLLILFGGTDVFIDTIRLVGTWKITSPNLSRAMQGS